MDKDISEIIEKCISLDPNKRPTAKELLTDKFFDGYDLEGGVLDVEEMFE